MDSVRSTCQCKEFSEDNLVLGIKTKLLDNWGGLTWFFVIVLLVLTWGAVFPFIVGWTLAGYYISPKYKCQFCDSILEKENFR